MTDDENDTEARNARGLVSCDAAACQAKLEPETPDEWRDAAEHWRSHHYLHGCSHGR